MSSLRSFWAVICGNKIPVWMTLLLIILGAFGSYLVAPKLNEEFQLQVAKREFLVGSMKDFTVATTSFIDGVSKLVNEKSPSDELKISLISKAVELNFFAVQLSYVIPEQQEMLLRFQEDVEQVQNSVALSKGGIQKDELVAQLKGVSVQSLLIYQALAQKAGLGK